MKHTKLNLVIAIIFMICLHGCITPTPDYGTNKGLIDRYYTAYLNATNSSNIRISAMLKAYSTKVNYSPPYTWNEAFEQKNQYIAQVSNGYISSNYTVMATDEEIRIVDDFITDMINVNRKGYPRLFGMKVGQIAAAYIFRINDYEYDPNSP